MLVTTVAITGVPTPTATGDLTEGAPADLLLEREQRVTANRSQLRQVPGDEPYELATVEVSASAPPPPPPTEPVPTPQAASTSAPSGRSRSGSAACPISASVEAGLRPNAIAVYRSVCAAFPGVASSYGGYRPGDRGDHGSGRAVDIMVSGPAGWDIARYLQANAASLGITYVIYEQQIWMAGTAHSQWRWMSDRGSATANHYDHVHVSVR